jgi:hypothetical protein
MSGLLAAFKTIQSSSRAWSHLVGGLGHVGQQVAVLDELAPGLLVVDASGVAELLRPSSEMHNVRKLEGLVAVLKRGAKTNVTPCHAMRLRSQGPSNVQGDAGHPG